MYCSTPTLQRQQGDDFDSRNIVLLYLFIQFSLSVHITDKQKLESL